MQTTQEKIISFFHQFPSETFPTDAVILSPGQNSDFYYFIDKGAVKMTSTSKQGQTLILHIFFPGSFFSLLTLVTHQKNEYDFITLLPTTVHKVPQTAVANFIKSEPEVLYELHLRLLKGLNGLLKRIEQSNFTPAYNQVASLLLYFSKHFAEKSGDQTEEHELSVRITHQEISDWLGLSRENVSIQMKKLEDAGFIKVEKRYITLVDPDALLKISQN